MSALIVDPTDRTQAIVAETGKLAARLFMGKIKNPEAPTLAELDSMQFFAHGDPDQWGFKP